MSGSSWTELFRGRLAAYTLLLNLGIGLHAVDVFIIATVMPSVVADIGGVAFYTWPVMLYMVASIVGAASGGPVMAALGNQKGYAAGAAVFLLGTVGCAIAPAMASLLVARAVQGAGGGLVMALSMALVRELYPVSLRTRALASISATWGIAALLGPFVGGVFSEIGWWRGAFWAGVPVVALFMIVAWRTLPRARGADSVPAFPLRRIALLGAGVLGVAASALVESLAAQIVLVIVAIAMVALAFRLDRGAANRLFPSHPLSIAHPVGVAYLIFFLISVTHSAFGVFMPLLVQVLHGGSPLLAGFFNTILAFAWTAGSLGSSGLEGRWVRRVIVLGPLAITCGVVGQALVVVDGELATLAAFVALTGLGIGVCHPHIVHWTMSAARAGEEGLTASSISTIRSLGVAIGAAFSGLVANTVGLASGVAESAVATTAAWVYGLVIVAPSIATVLAARLVWLRRSRDAIAAEVAPPGPGD